MSRSSIRFFDSFRLETTAYSGGFPNEMDVFADVEVDKGGFAARGGSVRLARIANTVGILDADGTNDRVDFPAHASMISLGVTFTFEILFQTDSIASTCFVIGKFNGTACGITIQHTSTSTVVVTITDSAAATTTLTWTGIGANVLCGLQIVRSGAALTGYLNGVTVTGTMSATLSLAAGAYSAFTDNGASFMNGGIDNLRIWRIARTSQEDLYRRLANPRNPKVLFAYVFNQGTSDDVEDQGVFGAHATTAGSPTFGKSPLAVNPAHIQALGYNVRKTGTKELLAMTSGRCFSGTVL